MIIKYFFFKEDLVDEYENEIKKIIKEIITKFDFENIKYYDAKINEGNKTIYVLQHIIHKYF